MSTYRERLFIWPEMALDAVFFTIVVWGGWWAGLIGLGIAVAFRLLLRRYGPENHLRLDAEGLHFPRMEVPWSNIARIERGRRPLSWSDQLVLERPLVYPKWLSFQSFRKVSLQRYERDWVNGRIGQDVARWAPHLLEERDRAHA